MDTINLKPYDFDEILLYKIVKNENLKYVTFRVSNFDKVSVQKLIFYIYLDIIETKRPDIEIHYTNHQMYPKWEQYKTF